MRVFCCFDNDRLVVFLSAFQKKSQKTPRREMVRALKMMNEYYESKK
ncbi:MAG: type II toxin-antitoxin system RelE/ParE family toxin [Flavobacteriales bacterium]